MSCEEAYQDDGPDTIGCWNCEGGWKHGCMDDLCRGSLDACDCDDGYACRLCNPTGEVLW